MNAVFTVLAVVGWLGALAFVVTIAVRGIRGKPVKLPYRGGGGAFHVDGPSARVVGWMFAALALFMLALPVMLLVQFARS